MRTLVFSPQIVRKAQSLNNQKKKKRERERDYKKTENKRAEIWQRSWKEKGRERRGKD